MLKNSSVSRVEGRGVRRQVSSFRPERFDRHPRRVISVTLSAAPHRFLFFFFYANFGIFFFHRCFDIFVGGVFFFLSIFQIFNEKCHPTLKNVGTVFPFFFFLNWKCFPCTRETCGKKYIWKNTSLFSHPFDKKKNKIKFDILNFDSFETNIISSSLEKNCWILVFATTESLAFL